jgi:hypothetical protein
MVKAAPPIAPVMPAPPEKIDKKCPGVSSTQALRDKVHLRFASFADATLAIRITFVLRSHAH